MYNLVQSGCIVDRIGLLIPRRKIIDDFGHWIELVFFLCMRCFERLQNISIWIYLLLTSSCMSCRGRLVERMCAFSHALWSLQADRGSNGRHSFFSCMFHVPCFDDIYHLIPSQTMLYRVCVCVFRPALHLTLEQTMNTADSYGKRPSSMQIDILANHIIDHISSTPLLWRGCRNSTLCIIIELIAVRTHTYQRLKQFPFVCG